MTGQVPETTSDRTGQVPDTREATDHKPQTRDHKRRDRFQILENAQHVPENIDQRTQSRLHTRLGANTRDQRINAAGEATDPIATPHGALAPSIPMCPYRAPTRSTKNQKGVVNNNNSDERIQHINT